MKKLMTILTAVVMLVSTSAFAAKDDTVTERVKAAFKKDFITATDVSWKKKSDFYFAWFTMNNLIVNAAYNEDGELVCTSRDIAVTQLPIGITIALAKNYSQYSVPEIATELNYEGETNYYITVSDAKQSLKLKFRANGEANVEEKIKHKK